MGGGYAGEAGVAAGGGVEVEGGRRVVEDGGADEVSDAAGGVSCWREWGGVEVTYRDLKEPEGWRFSSLRNMRLHHMLAIVGFGMSWSAILTTRRLSREQPTRQGESQSMAVGAPAVPCFP